MIRILQVVSSLSINAGMMSVIMNYYRNIDRSLIQFDFWYFNEVEDTHQAEIEKLGGKTFHMPYRSFKPSDQQKIRSFFTEHKGVYTAVHCHPIWASTIIANEAKKSGIKHVIQHSHSTKYSDKRRSAIRNKLVMKFVGFFATDFIACNSEAALLFGRRRVNAKKVDIIPNAIDIHNYTFDHSMRENVRREFGVDVDAFVLGTVGRLSKEKNQCFAVEVFKTFNEMIPNSKLVLVGEGSYREQIEKKIDELQINHSVIMTGKRRDIKAILSGLDVFLMPSAFEGTPVSAIEARSSGLPCLLSDTITRNVKMEGVKFLPINKTVVPWVDESLSCYKERIMRNRNDYSAVVEAGFDISTEACRLQNYYIGL